jgi:DNA-binding NtrC family response regulator
MPSSPVRTTVSIDETAKPGTAAAPAWVFVLIWSAEEPHRIAEVGFLRAYEDSFLGRGGDKDPERFVHLVRHRPGEPLAPRSSEPFLAGDAISRSQLRLHATAVGVEMEVVGRCPTFVNGEATTRAILKENDTVLLRRQALFVCMKRPRSLVGPRTGHAFGGADKYNMVGEAPATWALRDLILRIAATDYNVLIRGESGTGKELVAALIHRASKRAKGAFVSRNVTTIPKGVAEVELFGNAAGFPNHVDPARPGLFGAADGGSLFLDEIGDCPLELQAQLLRVLDNGEVTRLGESAARRVDVRFIGATLRDDDSFRPDLRERFQRVIVLPTLRERREDIPLLVRHWVVRQAKEEPALERFLFLGPTKETEVRVSPHLIDYLVRNPPPRNVRQLNNFLAEAADASPGGELVLPSSLPAPKTTPPAAPEKIEAVRRARRGPNDPDPTREETLAALRAVAHNFTQAADVLGVHRNTVKRLTEKYGISRDETLP